MVILQFDDAYYNWGLLAVRSLALHESQVPVLCNTVNLREGQIAELQGAHPLVEVTNGVSDRRTTPDQMAARKPFVMQHAMEYNPGAPWYALLDADFLVRRPLGALWAYLDQYPAAICITDGVENGLYYPQLVTPSGIVLARREGRKLVDCWAKWLNCDRPLGAIEPRTWFWDQVTLAEAWKESRVPCATIPLELYADDRLLPYSAIWSANVGDRKPRYYELFCEEHARQRREAAIAASAPVPAGIPANSH